jgi:hypothetical protein
VTVSLRGLNSVTHSFPFGDVTGDATGSSSSSSSTPPTPSAVTYPRCFRSFVVPLEHACADIDGYVWADAR